MIIHQFRLGKMANFSYIVEDPETKQGVLIDPASEVNSLLREIKILGITLTGIINTHGHFDHTAGNQAMVDATGAPVMIHREDAGMLSGKGHRRGKEHPSPKPSRLLKEGATIKVGKGTLRVLHTPGHTPGGIALYTPGHVITGDTLFVGAVGRTDIPGGSFKMLKRSVREKIFTLPDDTVVWPGHDYGKKPKSTVGYEKRHNPHL